MRASAMAHRAQRDGIRGGVADAYTPHPARLRRTTLSAGEGKDKIQTETGRMLRATKDIKLPTTITGALPRPSWYTKNICTHSFVNAYVNTQFREQSPAAV